MEAQRELLTEREVSNEYGLPEKTLQLRRCRGDRPHYLKVGRRVYYERIEVEDWLDACRRASTSDPGAAEAIR